MSYYGDVGGSGLAYPRLTPAIRVLLLVNVGVALVNLILRGYLSTTSSGSPGLLSLSMDGLTEGYGFGIVRLVTYQFTHSFLDPFHLLINMVVLYFFGTMVEESIGSARTFRLYVLSGIGGGLVYLLAQAATESQNWVVGASGSTYGIMVYAALKWPRAVIRLFFFFPIQLGLFVGILVFLGIWRQAHELQGIAAGQAAHSAHLGGALFGFLCWRFRRFLDFDPGLVRKVKAQREASRAKSQANKREVLDQLLDKVHREGISSLTPAEKRFLEKASKDLQK